MSAVVEKTRTKKEKAPGAMSTQAITEVLQKAKPGARLKIEYANIFFFDTLCEKSPYSAPLSFAVLRYEGKLNLIDGMWFHLSQTRGGKNLFPISRIQITG